MCLQSQVTAVAFGSVPLGTYLPDGDIDLSIYSYAPNAQEAKEALRDTWATKLQFMLEEDIGNARTKFKVADVQVIHAEVRAPGPQPASRLLVVSHGGAWRVDLGGSTAPRLPRLPPPAERHCACRPTCMRQPMRANSRNCMHAMPN